MRLHSAESTDRLTRKACWQAAQPLGLNFTPKDAAELQDSIQGTVVLPTDADYPASRQTFVPTFQQFPQILVYCASIGDVRHAIAFSRKHGLDLTCRSGGHSTAGYSVNAGMVVDTSRLNHVVVDPDAKLAHVGAGTYFEKLYATLDLYGLHAPGAGGCYNVAVGGYIQGGGYGFTSLLYGMSSDNVVEMQVAMADGGIVVASETENKELFWALRGGTGNNFGVVLQVTYNLQKLPHLWGFGIKWPLKSAAPALCIMQQEFTGNDVPADLGYQCLIEFVNGEPSLLMRGVYKGSQEGGKKLLDPLLSTQGAKLEIDKIDNFSSLNEFLLQFGTVSSPLARVRTETDSRYVEKQLSEDDWSRLVDCFLRSPNQTNLIGLEPYGGAINKIGPQDTSFVHRTASFDVYAWTVWLTDDEAVRARAFLDDLMTILDSVGNGRAYQNYPRRSNAQYRSMYWGENFEQLLSIKQQYDPDGIFNHGQSVSPSPANISPAPGGPKIFPKIPALKYVVQP